MTTQKQFKAANGADIRVRFTQEQALDIINDIKIKICGRDIDDMFEDNPLNNDEEFQKTYKRLIQAVRCGLVEWSEGENCLIQQLIRPLKSGNVEAVEFKYKNRPTISELQNIKASNEIAAFIEIMSDVTARPPQLIGQLNGQDLQIAMGCMSFFVN